MIVTVLGVHSGAVAIDPGIAKDRFDQVVTRKDDPALLELVRSTDELDRLSLQVFRSRRHRGRVSRSRSSCR